MKKLFFIFIFSLLLPALAHALTLGDLVLRSRQMVGDTPYFSAVPKMTDQRIVDFLNEGHKYICANGWFLTKRYTFPLVGGTTEYILPADIQAPRRVSMDGAVLPETLLESLDYNAGAWIVASGSPGQYYVRTTSVSVIGFYPAPLVTTTGTIVMDYIAQPNTMSAVSDIPFLGLPELYPLHEALAKYVAYRYFMLLGNDKMVQIYGLEITADMKRMKEILETKPNFKPGFGAQR